MFDPNTIPPEAWAAMLAGEAPPAPPAYEPPQLLSPQQPGVAQRIGTALSGVETGPAGRPYESAGSALVRGLLTGGAQGFSRTMADRSSRTEATRQQTNAARTAEADRNYENARDTWRAKLTAYYRTRADQAGKVRVTQKMANDMGVPEAVGTLVDPLDASARITARGNAGQTDPMSTVSDPAIARVLGVSVGTKVKIGDYRQAYDTLHPHTNATASPDELALRRDIILQGIANGTMDPNIELYGTNRDGLKGMLAEGAVKMGLDLATLRQNWYANKKGLGTANSPQQLRMRQAANNIPMLLDQMAGPADQNGNRSGGVIGSLNSSRIPWWNTIAQAGQKATGHAGALKQYNILASKLAMEQAFIMSGGNQPPDELYRTLRAQYAPTDNPANIMDALATVEETVRGYQQSVADVGPITRSTPYTPGGGPKNPFSTPGFNLGLNPPAGTTGTVADPFARWRPKGKP